MTVERDAIRELLRQLSNVVATALLYTPEHAQVVERLPKILDPLRQLLRVRPELVLVLLKGEVLYQGKPLEKDPNIERLSKVCAQLDVGHLRFLPGVDASELRMLIRCLVGQQSLDVLRTDQARIRLGGVEKQKDEDLDRFTPIESFDQLTTAQLDGLNDVYSSIGDKGSLDIENIATLVGGFIAAFKQESSPLLALVPIRNIDDYTFTHSINVGILNIAQGMTLGVEGQMLHDLGIAGMMHDAGKIFVDREIIQKPDKLTDQEWGVMKSHPSRGAQYLMGQKGLPTVAVLTAYEHHMRYDLSGYPSVPEKWKLNLCSQMTMISDTFDALRTRRAYKDSWDFPKVSGLLLELAGKQLNPDLTINFLKTLAAMGEDLPKQPVDDAVPLKGNYCE